MHPIPQSRLEYLNKHEEVEIVCCEFDFHSHCYLFSRIKEEKENDHPKTIPLKVHTKEMGNLLYVSVLTVIIDDYLLWLLLLLLWKSDCFLGCF